MVKSVKVDFNGFNYLGIWAQVSEIEQNKINKIRKSLENVQIG